MGHVIFMVKFTSLVHIRVGVVNGENDQRGWMQLHFGHQTVDSCELS